MSQLAFIVFQDNDNARYLVEAIAEDNPHAEVQYHPAMIRIQAEKRLVINRATVEEKIGREWDVQEMLLDVISIGGNVDEDDDHFILEWKN
ncbi:MAG: monooxygenase [Pseudomonadales bacterium]|jgi:phenol/toluene 2-monooxygenase (NADH) P2/A2|uniref:MmoB/DmpM family protein n=1 Tax=Halopseudomonas sp. TaxID=2901191 RepID=UPI000C93B7CF|nr:monooxygenase [Pseudomonadales bacterium]MAK72961.1 monooxygenase [Pseudomonadales bacterium]MAS66450.1 monooxygenase [Pseudomonadales bacterium]MCK5531956.1 MmoB/DmpM family protein [Halopseudomonas aestusnigri]|tara:strand:+ start:23493 stop:23765 length:273 start_codon:yes stop_codon:yes gene_type:complete